MSALRISIPLLLLALLTGCQAFSPFGTVRTAAIAGVERAEDVPAFQALSVGQMRVRINRGATGRMLLAREEGGTQQWLASDGKAIWLRDGRIVATRGLRDDLHMLQPLDEWPRPACVARAADEAAPRTAAVYARSAATPETGLVLEYTMRRVDKSLPVQLEEGVVALQRLEERVYHPITDAQWTNVYWVHPDSGQVLISSQRLPGTRYAVRMEAPSVATNAARPTEE